MPPKSDINKVLQSGIKKHFSKTVKNIRSLLTKLNSPSSHPLPGLAKQFGTPNIPPLAGTRRSGLTPLHLPDDRSFLTDQEKQDIEAIEAFQRDRLGGWTSSELDGIGALIKEDAKPNNLDASIAPLHPIFYKNKWDEGSVVPVEAKSGNWTAHNPVVWQAMLPSLRLASLFLANTHCWPWWDALIFGRRLPIASPPAPQVNFSVRFNRRTPDITAKQKRDADEREYFLDLVNHVKFNISAGLKEDKKIHKSPNCYGYTLPGFSRTSTITVACELLSPLLRDDLTSSQKLLAQFQVAVTVIHEISHALNNYRNGNWGDSLNEPYFEDEPLSELGLSLENSLFGYTIAGVPSLSYKTRSYMPFVLMAFEHPSFVHYHFSGPLYRLSGPTIALGNAGATEDSYGLPMSFIEDIQQANFWRISVPTYGADVIKVYPRIHGLRRTCTKDEAKGSDNESFGLEPEYEHIKGPDWDKYVNHRDGATDGELEQGRFGSVNPVSAEARFIEIQRVRSARDVARTLDMAADGLVKVNSQNSTGSFEVIGAQVG